MNLTPTPAATDPGAEAPEAAEPGTTGLGTMGPDAAEPEAARDGRAARWDDHRDQRRTELAHAARRAVHRAGPEVSMEDIATEAGTSKSIVYRYFADKTALQQAVLELVVTDIEATLARALAGSAGARAGLTAMVEAYLEMIESSPNVYAFVTATGTATPHARLLDQIGALLADTLAAAGDSGARAWGAGALGFVRGAGEWWLARREAPGIPDRAAAAERITDWLWAGVEP